MTEIELAVAGIQAAYESTTMLDLRPEMATRSPAQRELTDEILRTLRDAIGIIPDTLKTFTSFDDLDEALEAEESMRRRQAEQLNELRRTLSEKADALPESESEPW